MSSLYYNPNSRIFRFHSEDYNLLNSLLELLTSTEYDCLYGDISAENAEMQHFFIRFWIVSNNPYTEEMIVEWAVINNVRLTIKEG